MATNQEGKRTQKLKLLSKAAVAFSSSLDLARTLSRVAQEAAKITDYHRAIVFLLDEKGERLTTCAISSASSRRRANDASNLPVLAVDDDVHELLALRKPVCIETNRLPQSLSSLLNTFESQSPSVLLVPLLIESTFLGLVLLTERQLPDTAGEFELELAKLFASHAAAAIRNAQSVRAVNLELFETVARGKREWEQTFDAISDGIFISDAENVVVRANKAFAAKFARHPRDVIGKKCHEVIWRKAKQCAECPQLSMSLNPQQQPIVVTMESIIQGMESEVTAYPIMDYEDKLSAVVHVVKDVTQQKRMQDLVIRSEKLRAVGEMASGIAHDFNNLLASLIGWSEIMLLGDIPPHLKESAVAIHQAAVDGTETVKRIQEYTRIRKDTEFESIDINDVVRGAIDLARPRWKDWAEKAGVSINVVTEFDDIPLAQGNASDLREVFLNVIFNAIDAMPQGGEIRIRTGKQDSRVFASISDTGVGMPEEVQRRVFDPFFTTKGSSGNGLGLSVAYGIVSRHGGELTVESVQGKGSTFTVFLPEASETAEPQEQQIQVPSRKARILLVDDDKRVLQATDAMLRSEGHSVTKYLGGKEAIASLGEQEYDLVITDLGMPEMNGWDVAAKVKAMSPNTPVVLLTGWGAEIATERLLDLGVDAVVQKPCRLPTLRQTIDQVLNSEKTHRPCLATNLQLSNSKQGLRILVIEDNKWFGQALRERLELDGHVVSIAMSGTEGVQALENQEFDLVLSDLKLPDLTGLEIAGIIRQVQRKAFVAIMTGDVAGLDNSLLQGDAADAVLHKPWKEHELQQVIDRAFQRGSVN